MNGNSKWGRIQLIWFAIAGMFFVCMNYMKRWNWSKYDHLFHIRK